MSGAALVLQMPPAEEPTESAAKEHQCIRYHRSKEREESATRATAEGGWPGLEEEGLHGLSLKDSWGEHR